MKKAMKRSLKLATMMLVSCLITVQLWAADYASMSTDELSQIRGTLQNATVEERSEFQKEWRSRLSNMTQEERAQFMGPPKNAPRNGFGFNKNRKNGKGYGMNKNRGKGNQKGNGRGKGMGRGSSIN